MAEAARVALAALPGTALGYLGQPSTASSAAWAAAGAAARMLHDAPLPPRRGRSLNEVDELASQLDGECEWLVTNGVLPTNVVTRNRRVAGLRCGRGHGCSCTATCRSPMYWSTTTRSPA